MWIAAVRLSSRRMWHSSWVSTASSCGFVRRSMMPAGKSRTGRSHPITPRSSRPGDERTSTFAGIFNEVLERTAARIRSQALNRTNAITPNPHNHRPRIAIETQSEALEVEVANDKVAENGWVICTTVNETACVAFFFEVGTHSRWLPRLTNNENGT